MTRKKPNRLSGQHGNTIGKKETDMSQMPTPPAGDSIAETLVLIITGLGLTLDPPAFVGGVLMAMAGATLSRHFAIEQSKRRLSLTIFSGVFVGIMTALGIQSFDIDISPQLAMGGGGFLATFALPWILKKAPAIADKMANKKPLP